jgi:serine/threonine protein kinase
VLITGDGIAKVADFGLSTLTDRTVTKNVFGTLHILAPEILQHQEYDERVDIYAYGILLAELFSGSSFHRQLRRQVEFEFEIVQLVIEGARPTLPESLPAALRNLLTQCWSPNPALRPRFAEIVHRLSRFVDEANTRSSSSPSSSTAKGDIALESPVEERRIN